MKIFNFRFIDFRKSWSWIRFNYRLRMVTLFASKLGMEILNFRNINNYKVKHCKGN